MIPYVLNILMNGAKNLIIAEHTYLTFYFHFFLEYFQIQLILQNSDDT